MSLPPGPVTTLHEHTLLSDRPAVGQVHLLTSDIAPHAHDFVEVAIVGEGDGRHVTSRGETPLQHGDVLVLRPGAWHGFSHCTNLTVANCCISAHALRGELAPLHDIRMFRQLLWSRPMAAGAQGVMTTAVEPSIAQGVIDELGRMQAERSEHNAHPGRLLGRLITVLGELADGTSPPAPSARAHPAVAAAITELEAAPAHPWRLDELATTVNVDPDYLGRLFRQYVGLTPLGYLARVRAELAATQLARTTMPVGRVGASVGWADPTYFARRFRTLVGLTPTAYRQQVSR